MNLPPPPPRLEDLRAGTRLVAGIGHSTVLADMDFETYSEAGFIWNGTGWDAPPFSSQGKKGLPVVGVARYAKHPSTEVLCLAYNLKDGSGPQFWRPGLPPPLPLFQHLQAGGLIEAHNVGFERWIWEEVCVKRMGWPPINPKQYRCSAAKARASAYPGALADVGRVLAIEHQKDPEGDRLLKKFSMPRNPTKKDPRTRVRPLWTQADVAGEFTALSATVVMLQADHEDTLKLGRYCERDIVAESEVSARCPDLEGDELAFWQAHEEINHRGVHIDTEGVEHCGALVVDTLARLNEELQSICGIESASKVAQLQGWLHGQGVHLNSLDEETVTDALTWTLPPTARRVLEIRSLAGSASVKKVFAIANKVTESGHLADLYVYSGARTGRSTGSGPQPTNLPNSAGVTVWECQCGRHYGKHRTICPWCGEEDGAVSVEWNPEAVIDALECIKHDAN